MGAEQGLRAGARRPQREFIVVGTPIAHSMSPVMHRAAYEALGIDDAVYGRAEVREGELEAFLAGPGSDLQGLSVTMPLKREAFELAVEADDVSHGLGISNTLIRRPDGSWRAENHDVDGIARSLHDHGVDRIDRAAIIGSGATALSAVAALTGMGAREIVLTARSTERLEPVVAAAEVRGARCTVIDWIDRLTALAEDVVVSALAIEGADDLAAEVRSTPAAPVPRVMLDVLYDPWPAPLAAAVQERGTEVASGLRMLAHQAARQVESMLGVSSAPAELMLAAARAHLAARG